MLERGWEAQWARVLRRLDEVRAIHAGRPGSLDAAVDVAQTFFQTLHHLPAWLGNDPTSGVAPAESVRFVDTSLPLQLCAELATGSRHLAMGGARTAWPRLVVEADGTEHEVLPLAEDAVAEWAAFLAHHELI